MENLYFKDLEAAVKRTVVNSEEKGGFPLYEEGLLHLLEIFKRYKVAKSQVFFIGNGGSAAIASHMTGDFMKNGGMRTCSLYNSAVMTCIANDYGYEHIFAKPLSRLGNPSDLLVAISSSGNSPNIVRAVQTAKEMGIFVTTFTGFKADNKARQLGNLNVYVPCEEYGKVETIHQLILQQIVDMILEQDGVGL